MAGLNREDEARATKIETAILNRLAHVGQGTVALRLGLDETSISKWKKDGRISQIAQMLALLDLKCVSTRMRCYPPEYINALRTMADIGQRVDPMTLDGLLESSELLFDGE